MSKVNYFLFSGLLFIVFWVGHAAAAPPLFRIRSVDNTRFYGPVDYTNGAMIKVEEDNYTITNVDPEKKTFLLLKVASIDQPYGPYTLANGTPITLNQKVFVISDITIPGLKLSASYKSGMAGRKELLHELFSILSPHGEPCIDLEPYPDIKIYGDVTYLMPLTEAVGILSAGRLASGSSMNLPGFPQNSFKYHQSTGLFSDGCNKLLIVTDLENQTVAISFVDEQPNRSRISQKVSESIYNFVQHRTAAISNRTQVHRSVEKEGNVVIIKSEFRVNGRPKEYTELYIPTPVVNLALETLRHFRAK